MFWSEISFILFIHLLHGCVHAISPSGLKLSFPFCDSSLLGGPFFCEVCRLFLECPLMHPQSSPLLPSSLPACTHWIQCSQPLTEPLHASWGSWWGEFGDPKSSSPVLNPASYFVTLSILSWVLQDSLLFLCSIQSTLPHFSFLVIFFSPSPLPFHSFCNISFPILSDLVYPSFLQHTPLPMLSNSNVIIILANQAKTMFPISP